MRPFFFRRREPEFTDGVIDLIPLRVPPADPRLRFGRERIWRVALHGNAREIGQISYREGESRCVFYYGHIGYHIDPDWRGHHYAWRACCLIRDEVYRSGKCQVVITCDPDNAPSRKTCERLGCLYEGTVRVPEDILKSFEISPVKCRYIWCVGRNGKRNVHGNQGDEGLV